MSASSEKQWHGQNKGRKERRQKNFEEVRT